MPTMVYGKDWSEHYREVIEPVTEATARKRHRLRKPYSAILFEQDRASVVVSFYVGWVGAKYLDDVGRVGLLYLFKEVSPGRLFLHQAKARHFDRDTGELTEVVEFTFEPEGFSTIRRVTLPDRAAWVSAREKTDTSANWEPYPEFGQLAGVARRERTATGQP